MNPRLIEKRKELEAKQDKLSAILKEGGPQLDMEKVTSLKGSTTDKVAEIRKMNEELSDLGKQVDDLVALEKMDADLKGSLDARLKAGNDVPHPPAKDGGNGEPKSIGEMFVESKAFKGLQGSRGPAALLDIDLKTAMTTAAGWAPQSIRTGKVVDYATRPIQVIDIVPAGRTTQAAIVYMEETTFTNNAAEATESTGSYGEAALALTERSSTVRKIAVFLPVTQEQLEDVEGIQSYLNNRLTFMLRQRLDGQIITGDGSAPNLGGILNTSGIQTFALAGDKFDAIYEAAKRVRVTGRAQPNVLVAHPNDWQDLRLQRTVDGLYVLGNPNEAGPSRIWGLNLVETDAITENKMLVGDFANHIQLFEKRGIEIDVTDSHDTYFIYGKMAIRASFRVALPVYRPAAFCVVTGM